MNNMRQHYFESRANMPAEIRRALAALAIAVPALGAALPAQASTFTVGGSGTLDGQNAAMYPLDASGETTIPATDKPARFFRLQATKTE